MAIIKGDAASDFAPVVTTLDLVSKFISQEIDNVKADDALEQYFPTKKHGNDATGLDVEKSLVAMAEEQAYDPTGTNIWDNHDPLVVPEYFNTWDEKQFIVTKRYDDIRAASMRGESAEEIAGKIIDSVTQGAGDYAYRTTRSMFDLSLGFFKNYSGISGREPKDMKGVLYMLRDAYYHLIATNDDATANATTFRSRALPENVRIVIPTKLLNLIDVTELANVFNMEKADILGKIVPLNVDDLADGVNDDTYFYTAFVLDKNAIVKEERTYEYAEDRNNTGRYVQHVLTVDRMYGLCGLFKAVYIDCITPATAALGAITTAVTP